jgi:hypothetical protein
MEIVFTTSTSILAALMCVAFSLVSGPSYGTLVFAALLFAALHVGATFVAIKRGRSVARYLILLATLIVLLFTLDNVGRVLGLLDLPSFRVLI